MKGPRPGTGAGPTSQSCSRPLETVVRGGRADYLFDPGTRRLRPRLSQRRTGTFWGISMHMIAKLTRAQLETLIFVFILALLSVTSSVFDVPAGVDSDRSATASSPLTTFRPAGASAPLSVDLAKF
jgi:hypothetical protein